jgi:hypothetical protein
MAGSDLNFDANKVKPNSKPDPIPVGEYRLAITSSEVKPVSTGKGRCLNLELVVLDEGQYKGRKIFTNLNVQHENAQAQEIAQGELSAICHATGVLTLTNSSQLHNKPMLCKVAIKPGNNGYDPKNVIKSYKPADGSAVVGSVAPAAAAAPVAANAPAWARKTG